MFILLLGIARALTPYDSLLDTQATSPADEYAIGKEYVTSQLWFGAEWKNPTEQARVERITRRVIAASDRPDFIVNVVLLDDARVNAAALPGGFLLINRGLVTMMTDDELAFVLGHELAHALLRHGASQLRVKEATASVAALSAARAGNDPAAARARADELYLMVAAHSRELELDADLYGLVYATRAGYAGAAADTALQKVAASLGELVGAQDRAWASHPLTADRIAELTKGRTGMEKVAAEFDAGLTFLDQGRPSQAVTSFQQFLALFPQSQAGWSNLAAAWMLHEPPPATGVVDVVPLHRQSGVRVRGDAVRLERAADALGHALRLDPADPVALALAGALARQQGKLPEARAFLERGLARAPADPALLTNLGNVLYDEKKPAEAIARWIAARDADPTRPEPRVNLARAHEERKEGKEAIAAWQGLVDDRTWGATARERLAVLGSPPGAPAVVVPPGALTITVNGQRLPLGMSLAELLAALGPPDSRTLSPDQATETLFWTKTGVKALVTSERVAAWLLRQPTTALPGEGMAFGQGEEDLTARLGPADVRFVIGGRTTLVWWAKGLTAVLLDGELRDVTLYKPR